MIQNDNARELVREILTTIPETRNNDLLLCFTIWKRQGIDLNLIDLQVTDGTLYNPETIIRHRAFIQNTQGELLPTRPGILIRRKIAERHIRQYYKTQPDIITDWEQLKYSIK